MSHRTLARCLVAAGCSAAALTVLSGAPPARAQNPQISPVIPTDIGSGASSATLAEAAAFAWQEFIALNWPALQQNGTVQRGQADTGAMFGQAGATPLVWESFRQKVEIFPGANSADVPPHGGANYSDPPLYLYSGGSIPNGGVVDACPGQPPVAQAPWINLDETSQIGLNQMYAGVVDVPATTQPNSAPQLIRFLAKANQTEYDYIFGNQLWFTTGAFATLVATWQAAIGSGQPPNPSSVITLPAGTIEMKAAWRPLAKDEDASRFHMATVRYYEPGPSGLPCYRQDQWALAALHIIQKTPSAPYFVFATFEQADNLLNAEGGRVEDPTGKVVAPPADGPNTPALIFADSPTFPTVTTNPANTFCDSPGKRLYYRELPPSTPPAGTPVGGSICVDNRYEAIPLAVQEANSTFQALITTYNAQNNLNSPWPYYKLINVQAVPLNLKDISMDPTSTRQVGSFYQADIVVETDYTLQQFLGRIAADQAPTRYPKGGMTQNFQNVYVPDGNHFDTYQMGGCMGCHGNAQVGGTDFSFIVGGNGFNTTPDVPQANLEKQALYLSLFGNPLPANLKK